MSPRPEPVLILHHALPAPGSCPHAESDAGVLDEVKIVSGALRELHIPFRVAAVETLAGLPRILQAAPERLVFNLVENFPGRPADAMQVPVVCEAFGRECTGNPCATQTLALDKWRTKAVLQAAGLPVPAGVVIPLPAREQVSSLARAGLPPPPWIVKPLFTDASEGIYPSSVVNIGAGPLQKAVARVHHDFRHPALVEQFFGTRELNIALFQQGRDLVILPVAEIEFRNFGAERPRIVDYAAKWHASSFEYQNTVRVVPARVDQRLAARLRTAAREAWNVLGCRDYARVDFRLDEAGRFVVLEVNPNPDIAPDSGFEAALRAAGIPYRAFIKAILANARARLEPGREAPPPRTGVTPKPRTSRHPGFTLRRTRQADRDAILDFMDKTGFFHGGDIDVAREVLDEALAKGPAGHYQSYTLVEKGQPRGWICYGPTPCTIGTYDIYWIGVSAASQGRGYGRALLEQAERQIRRQRGRVIIIETSGRPLYDSTRGFYLKTGYREVARVPEFYAAGDDRVIYSKRL